MESQIISNINLFKNLQIGHKYKYVDLCEILGNQDYKVGRKNIRFRVGKEGAIEGKLTVVLIMK